MHKFKPLPERCIHHTMNEEKGTVVKAWTEEVIQQYVLEEISDIETKLNWVLENEPEFDRYGKWYMKWWRHFPMSSDQISGWWIATGGSKMECVENAMSGNCDSME